jgi:hypothetical protein
MWRRRLLALAAVVAVPASVALALLGLDVLRVPGQLEADDVRFQAAPKRQSQLWTGLGFLPGDPGERLLEVDDDVAYRQVIANFVKVGVGQSVGATSAFGPEAENRRGRAQFELTTRSAEDSNPKRRSVLLNLLAVMSLDTFTSDAAERENILRTAIFTLRSAVEVDPTNEDAKVNLELALRDAKATNLPGTDPESGAAHGSLSGQGRTGTGY